jgi:hypothetical protein
MIRRNYRNNGDYQIKYGPYGAEIAEYLEGGNCGCSNCLKGAGFFDSIADALPDILRYVPIAGSAMSVVSSEILNALDPYRQNPRNPIKYKPEYSKAPQRGAYLTNQYKSARDRLNKGRGGMTQNKKKKKKVKYQIQPYYIE